MADSNHPRKFTEEFRRQIVQLYLAGKPRGELMVKYDLGSSTLFHWIKCRGKAGVSACWPTRTTARSWGTRQAAGRTRGSRRRVREPRHRRPAGGVRYPEVPLPQGRPTRQRGHRARQQDPEEEARLSAGVRRPRPAPPRAQPMRPVAQREEDAFDAGLHEPSGVQECRIVPVKNV